MWVASTEEGGGTDALTGRFAFGLAVILYPSEGAMSGTRVNVHAALICFARSNSVTGPFAEDEAGASASLENASILAGKPWHILTNK